MARIRRTAAALAATACISGIIAGSASAASFGFGTVAGSNGGKARAQGTITFHDAKSFTIQSSVRDECPADGFGAYLSLWVVFMDGTSTAWPDLPTTSINRDTNGCGTAFENATTAKSYGKRVRFAKLILREWDAEAFQVGDGNEDTLDNPHTG